MTHEELEIYVEELKTYTEALEIELKDRLTNTEVLLSEIDSKTAVVQTILNQRRTITKYEFLSRFTLEERVSLRNLALTNTTVEDMMELLKIAEDINLDEVSAYFPLLVGMETLTQERSDEILNLV